MKGQLKKTFPKDITLQLRARFLLLISLYEVEDRGVDLFSFCLNFESFLKRHRKELAEAVRGVANFVRIVKTMVQHKLSREQLLEQIANADLLYFKPWLLQKAEHYQAVNRLYHK